MVIQSNVRRKNLIHGRRCLGTHHQDRIKAGVLGTREKALKYVFEGLACEMSWGFLIPEGRYAETLEKCIMDHIKPLLDTS
uniref:Uncharacterized protein n=1 Tax=Timema tahoe TaxID=61484 RepID=A0A7R9ILI1_9NEOP|nr:unnamed protein product [Timema tahoe]